MFFFVLVGENEEMIKKAAKCFTLDELNSTFKPVLFYLFLHFLLL